jgi:ArsR family transcriptional regulator, arsenate/arsenite/antimonite-responsive transcriptional repressor
MMFYIIHRYISILGENKKYRSDYVNQNYEENSKIIKALSDANRLKIIDILSCGERCACDILEHFDFTQPTLSHHMKVLMDCGLVNSRKEGLWSYYSLNGASCNKLLIFLMNLVTDTDDCICEDKAKCNCK